MKQTGEFAPDFLGIDQDGKEVRRSDFPGKNIILYFYPKDNTSGCTAEACSLGGAYDSFLDKGYVVIGVSKDSAASHIKFRQKYALPFILIADTEHRLCEEMGVWKMKKMAGREYMGIVRTTFVIDPEGRISHVVEKVNTKEAAAQLEKIIKG